MGLILSGSGRVLLARNGEVVTVDQHPGTALFFPPWAWNVKLPVSEEEHFGIVVREPYVRFVHGRRDYRRTSRLVAQAEYHTSAPLSGPGRLVLDALRELAEQRWDEATGVLLLNALLRLCRDELANDRPESADKARQTFLRACNFLHERFHDAVNRDETARALGLHPNYLSRLFKEQSGQNFSSYVRRLRLNHAARLLSMTSLQVGEVVTRSGFGDPAHFYRIFREAYGISPGTYREREQTDPEAPAR